VLRGLAPSTQRAYLEAATKFARHYNRTPDEISNDELKTYLLYLHLGNEFCLGQGLREQCMRPGIEVAVVRRGAVGVAIPQIRAKDRQ
jgi:hypothetical protein